MASESDVQFVLDNIEDNYADNDWTLQEISDRLDAGAIKERVVAVYWRKRALESIELVTVSESGSSRSLDFIYGRMNALAEAWEAKATVIENPPESATTGRLSSSPIKRV